MFSIGADLGGSNLRVALVQIENAKANIVKKARASIGANADPQSLAELVAELVNKMGSEATNAKIGIGLAGMLRGNTGVVENAPNLPLNGVPFGSILENRLKRRVWIENDVNAVTWGEHKFGAAKGKKDVVGVFVGTGVGGGAVLDGLLYRGAGNASLEIGHVNVVTSNGRKCGCGALGCLETYVGGRHLVEWARESIPDKSFSHIKDISLLHAGHIDELARNDDKKAKELINQAGNFLGQVLASAITLLNPSCLVLGGTVWTGCPMLRQATLNVIAKYANAPALKVLDIVEAKLGDDAGVLGAADLALQCDKN